MVITSSGSFHLLITHQNDIPFGKSNADAIKKLRYEVLFFEHLPPSVWYHRCLYFLLLSLLFPFIVPSRRELENAESASVRRRETEPQDAIFRQQRIVSFRFHRHRRRSLPNRVRRRSIPVRGFRKSTPDASNAFDSLAMAAANWSGQQSAGRLGAGSGLRLLALGSHFFTWSTPPGHVATDSMVSLTGALTQWRQSRPPFSPPPVQTAK